MEEKIYDILDEICDEDIRELGDEDLFEEGYMDSMAVAELVVRVEEELGITLNVTEIERDEFNTAPKIVAYIASR